LETGLPDGFSLRAPTMDDAVAVAALITICGLAEGDVSGVDAAVIAMEWRQSGFDLSLDAWLIFAPDGTLAAFGQITPVGDTDYEIESCVLPTFTGRGFATFLVARSETRARERMTATTGLMTLTGTYNGNNDAARRMYEKAGFTPVRYFLHMHRKLDALPEEPVLPEGFTLRMIDPDKDERALYDTLNEAFADHWEFAPTPYDEWLTQKDDPALYDPTLRFLAEYDGEPAGALMCRYRGGVPWIQGLGVLRPWRRRGLGSALLRHAFVVFYARGGREVALNVDADSPTGATHLYERAGMTIASRFDMVRKTLREA
jgi:mycothiol synthase